MLDSLTIVSYGGVVLFQRNSSTPSTTVSRRTAVNRLIQEVLLEDRAAGKEFLVDDLKLKWSLENDSQFVVIATYSKFLPLIHVDAMLTAVKRQFSQKYRRQQSDGSAMQNDFAAEYAAIAAEYEAAERSDVVSSSVAKSSGGMGTVYRKENMASTSSPETCEEKEDNKPVAEDETESHGEVAETATRGSVVHEDGSIITKGGRRIGKRDEKRSSVAGASVAATAKGKPAKVPTKWEGATQDPKAERRVKATEEELEAQVKIQSRTLIKRTANGKAAPITEHVWENQPRGRLTTWLRSYVGKRELDGQDFAHVIPDLREKLISKNVAVEVAEHVCRSVEASLSGMKLGTFDSLQKTIEGAMVASLRRILEPKHEVNIIRAAASAKACKKPFSIVLCGVNGVGKSTSLAKLTYWLQQNDFSVLIAAGDTFRHGAVEQLEVHGRCLGVPIFQMGYGADPSAVASAAIVQAARQHIDVVLIDTAGRMQDHEPRMRALAKLIHDNQPGLVLFVGEALVGNNGIDQLRKFNQCLVDYAPVGSPSRGIDGIILTKFDTIDDKVGTSLSMVYELGQPIVFVGVGQTYQDLKVLDPDVVVNALMQ